LILASRVVSNRGQFEEARRLAQSALACDPLSAENYRQLGYSAFFGGRLGEAEAVFRRALDLNLTTETMHYRIALVLLVQGEPDAALAELEREPNESRRRLGLPLVLDALGRTSEADRALAAAVVSDGDAWSYQITEIYAHRNDPDQAFPSLERAYERRDPGLFYLKGDPLLANLRPDRRYKALLRKMKLPE
jgi:tetratricopeptide (TPR) repeat protein